MEMVLFGTWFGLDFNFKFLKNQKFWFSFDFRIECTESTKPKPNILLYTLYKIFNIKPASVSYCDQIKSNPSSFYDSFYLNIVI